MLLILLLIVALSVLFLVHARKQRCHSPPGPKGLPFIGNLHQYDSLNPHLYLVSLAKIYGPISSLKLGGNSMVVVQSAKLAKEVLKTQDHNFCSRPQMAGPHKLTYSGLDMVFAPYSKYFSEMKKLTLVHLLSSKRVQYYAPIRQEEVSEMIRKISSLSSASKIVNLSEMMFHFAISDICRIAFGNRYEHDEHSRSRFQGLLNEAQVFFTEFFFADYFPSMAWLDKLTGKSSRLEKAFRELDVFYDEVIKDHLSINKAKSDQEDIVDAMLRLMNKKDKSLGFDLSFNHIKAMLLDIFIGGTHTTAATVVWAMTELVKNPTSLKKVQEELRTNTPKDKGHITDEDIPKFEYLKNVVKETFRMYPAAPLLVFHESINRTTLENYVILPKTLVAVNAWAIGRDPKSWKDPEKFMPERFFGSSIDFKGQDFELIPFGSGRRICPGLSLGAANIKLALANLLYSFDWELPAGMVKEDVDTEGLPGIILHKKNPLCLVATEVVQ